MQNDAQKRNFKQKNIDAEYFYDIVWRDFARWVTFTGQLRNPWQTLAEHKGSAEPRLKITAIGPRPNYWVRRASRVFRGRKTIMMLILGLGVRDLALAKKSRPPPKSRAWDYKIHHRFLIRPNRAKMSDTLLESLVFLKCNVALWIREKDPQCFQHCITFSNGLSNWCKCFN